MAKTIKIKNSKSGNSDDDGPIELEYEDGDDTMKKNDSDNEDSIAKKADPLGDKLLFDEPSPKKKKKNDEHDDDEHEEEDESDEDSKFINLEEIHSDKARAKSEKSDYIHLKIPKPNWFWLERVAYWIIIIILLVMVFKSPVTNLFSSDNILGSIDDDDELQSDNITAPVENSTPTVIPAANKTDNKTTTPATNNTPLVNNSAPADKTCAKATPTIEITNVIMDDDNDKKVISVKAKIVNSNNTALEDYYLDLTWYNKDDLDEGLGLDSKQRLKPIGSAKYLEGDKTIAKCGGSYSMNFDTELVLPYVTSRDITNTFKIILRNGGGKEITSDTYTLNKA